MLLWNCMSWNCISRPPVNCVIGFVRVWPPLSSIGTATAFQRHIYERTDCIIERLQLSIPEIKRYEQEGLRFMNLQYDPEAYRFKTISDFKWSMKCGSEIQFDWKGISYCCYGTVCPAPGPKSIPATSTPRPERTVSGCWRR